MSTGSNFSALRLFTVFIERQDTYIQFQDRLELQETRLMQDPDQTSSLAVEQQDTNQRVSTVSDACVATAKLMLSTGRMLEGFLGLQPYFQQKLRDQISASFLPIFDDFGVMTSNLE